MVEKIFPKQFIWGAATASYQIEGGAHDDGRGETIWDRFSHTPGKVFNGDTGDVACDHYHRYLEDVQLMKEIGLKGYRFSIAWSRIFPEGRGKVNQKGVDFYCRLVDSLLENGIEPAVTLYHWDLPQALQDLGGWGNRDTTDYYTEYASYMFQVLGDRVKKWMTFNEPWVSAFAGHYQGRHAPGLTDLALAVQVSHHLLLSHAKAVQAYHAVDRDGGKIGIVLNLYPIHPASSTPADQAAAERVNEQINRWFLEPVFTGNYPQKMFQFYKEKFNSPVILPGDTELLHSQKIDFLGVNYYTRKVVKASTVEPVFHYEEVKPEHSKYTDMGWEVYPQGLTETLLAISKKYNYPVLSVTENGVAYPDDCWDGDVLADDDRLEFLKQHLDEAYKAIQAGIKLESYYVWSLLDNFEWAHGYRRRFGLIYVDYQTLKRKWKKSALWYRDVIRNNGF